jgi:hypothetical protein
MNRLEKLKKQIESMDNVHQIEILRILHQSNDVVLNENDNGIFVNLTNIYPNVLHEIETYVEYVVKQKKQLAKDEITKETIKNTFFNQTIDVNNIGDSRFKLVPTKQKPSNKIISTIIEEEASSSL